MTGRERFLSVIKHEKPDKLPLYIPTIACSVASEILGREAYTGADSLHFREEYSWTLGENAHAEFVEKHIDDCAELYRKLGVDVVRETWRQKRRPAKRLDDYTLLFGDEEKHIIKRYFPDTDSYGVVENTYRQKDAEELALSLKKIIEKGYTPPSKEACAAEIADDEKLFGKLEDLDLGHIVGGGIIMLPMGDTAWLELCVTEPEVLHDYFMLTAKSEVDRMNHLADRGYIWFNGGGDMASNTGPIFSPKVFEEVHLDALRFYAEACGKRGTIYSYRSDGNMWSVFDLLFKTAGAQAYGEVDRDAGMTVEKIRQANENLIVLGNTSSALLVQGTEEQIREDTRRQLEGAMGTNFIPGPSNAVVSGTPVKNLFAMIEEIDKFKP